MKNVFRKKKKKKKPTAGSTHLAVIACKYRLFAFCRREKSLFNV